GFAQLSFRAHTRGRRGASVGRRDGERSGCGNGEGRLICRPVFGFLTKRRKKEQKKDRRLAGPRFDCQNLITVFMPGVGCSTNCLNTSGASLNSCNLPTNLSTLTISVASI